ncbi:protein FRA10AC1 homolog [Clavelina lepadiformis]|uniref:protein FRA10AC1 homolog n=1 Tax=Clavelina lepadiformis TaxID=159417 RepID=UPI004041B011
MSNSKVPFEDIHGYGSEFSDCGSEIEAAHTKKKNDKELFRKPNIGTLGLLHSGRSVGKKPSKRVAADMVDVEEAKRMRYHGLLAMDAYARHKKFVNDYLHLYGGKHSDFKRDSSRDRTDYDVIRENHKFLWDDEQDADLGWERKLAKKYWNKLYKEYTICDLSRYKENKIAFRWRVEKEVISGKGQFSCSNKPCSEKEGLRSWEVNFAYVEENEKKNALVKCRLCPECSYKLNYHHKKKDITGRAVGSKKTNKNQHKKKKARRRKGSDEESTSSSSSENKKNEEDQEEHKIWSKPPEIEDEKSREDEFDDYFEGLFL